MKYTPHPFQTVAIDHIVDFLRNGSQGSKLFLTAPTGCGKSIIELEAQKKLEDCWIVSPREEIIAGMLDKLDDPDGDMLSHNLCTPIRLRNLLLKGEVRHPKHLLWDEGHHHTAESWQQVDLLTGCAPSVALSATGYRGSPKSTKELHEHWGKPVPIITFRQAANAGYISVPEFSVLPLVDDDVVDVRGGEFDITSIDSATVDRLGDMAEHARKWYTFKWDRPTIFALPSSACCTRLQHELSKRGLPSTVVSADTPKNTRIVAFQAARAGIMALLHINIVSEGVDLPLRRLVDLAPTMSPVRWVQQLGRITRPSTDGPPEYVCTNRNVLRHSYALEGVVPVSAIVSAEKAFGPTERAHVRALGLEAIGRFKPVALKLLSGATASMYNMSTVAANGVVVQYCVIVPPTTDPIWASKVNLTTETGKIWGTWTLCEPPTELHGFSSAGQTVLSEKQANWWNRQAHRVGLDPTQEVSKKNFQALPVLSDIGMRLT